MKAVPAGESILTKGGPDSDSTIFMAPPKRYAPDMTRKSNYLGSGVEDRSGLGNPLGTRRTTHEVDPSLDGFRVVRVHASARLDLYRNEPSLISNQ